MAQNFKRAQLDTPVDARKRRPFTINLDADAVGRGAESVARFLGTGKYLMWQTIIVILWILLNAGAVWKAWDPYPFILLNLAFSTQAAYAAPLILLAQNRQDDRDRIALDEDRRRSAQTKADTEFLARELAGLRLAVNDTVTRDYLRKELEDLNLLLERIDDKLDDHRADGETLPRDTRDATAQGTTATAATAPTETLDTSTTRDTTGSETTAESSRSSIEEDKQRGLS